jgi:RNA-directed DNA polymerase
MKDRVSNDIGVKEPLEDWASIDWKLVKKRVRNLRQRIYRATQNGQWNKVRSLMKLMLRRDKTNIIHVEHGFNFLGFHIRQFRDGCFTIPQKEKVKNFLMDIRKWLKSHQTVKPEAVISYLNPIIQGWGNYYKHSASKRVFSYVDDQIWKALWKWSLKRHPNKGKKWVAKKYFQLDSGQGWTFKAIVNDRRGGKKTITVHKLRTISIERHTKVKGNASPDDPTLVQHWQSRKTKYGKSYWVKGSKLYKVALQQSWKCPVCGEHLFNGEALHTHHKIAVKDGGQDTVENLIHIHQNCHRQIHMRKRSREQKA